MISDGERREVAARLRYEESAGPGCLNTLAEWYLISFLQSINKAVDNGTEYRLRERLANLIDRPIYRPVIPNEMEGGVFCPQCGAEIGEYGVPNYCYNCGVAIRNAGCGGALG